MLDYREAFKKRLSLTSKSSSNIMYIFPLALFYVIKIASC